ncbi:MAG: hydrogenase maturation nickel metallochaperone HypA [Sedimentisphaerales bacterium]|nr:hydrogenase maturation nickel metallochaperone HypA [Sedimentisphaerales bacterium]
MHETMVAESLVAAISAEAVKHNAKPVAARISCGGLSAVNDEILCFAFEAIARDTPCEGMKLQIEHKPLRAKCRNCSRDFDVDLSMPKCSECNSESFKLLADAPLLLEEIELQTD